MILLVQKELGDHKNQAKNKQLCEKMWLLLNDQVEEEEGDSEDDTIVIGHVSKTCAPPTPPTPPVFISMAKYPLPATQNGDHLVAVNNNDNRYIFICLYGWSVWRINFVTPLPCILFK
jgi:hypothetical protein